MAIEIKELIIRAQVNYGEKKEESSPGYADQPTESSNEALVQDCVKQVLKILKKQQQR